MDIYDSNNRDDLDGLLGWMDVELDRIVSGG